MSDSKLLRGTFVLTLGTYASRILGMIYLFPFYSLVGTLGGTLFGYGYAQYTIYLSLATAGVPMAVSKFVSKYNAMGDYYTSRRLFRAGIKLMLLTGFLAFAFLYLSAPSIAKATLGSEGLQNSIEDVTMVIRMVSIALIIVPMMSMIRGFFQGHQSMGPTAVSQVVEQLVRIVFLLTAAYMVIKVYNGTVATAVGFATFAAFVGALGGLGVLLWYWKKRKPHLDKLLEESVEPANITTGQMFKELFTYAGPFVFVGLAIPLFQYVDQYTFNKAMIAAGEKEKTEYMFGIIQTWVPKLVMIPLSIATAFGLTLVPTITKSFTDGDQALLKRQIDQTYQTIVFLVLPAVIGLTVLSYPIYGFLYDVKDAAAAGGAILRIYAPLALWFSFFTVNAAILQGINKQKYAVISLVLGLLVKIVFNMPFIFVFHEIGSILATALGYTVSIVYTFYMIKKYASYDFQLLIKRSLLMMIFALLMGLAVLSVQYSLSLFMTYKDGRLASGMISIAGAIIGAGVYLYASYRSGLMEKVMGKRLENTIRRKLLRQKSV
jgi:polysaccharide transporter, PST family